MPVNEWGGRGKEETNHEQLDIAVVVSIKRDHNQWGISR